MPTWCLVNRSNCCYIKNEKNKERNNNNEKRRKKLLYIYKNILYFFFILYEVYFISNYYFFILMNAHATLIRALNFFSLWRKMKWKIFITKKSFSKRLGTLFSYDAFLAVYEKLKWEKSKQNINFIFWS